MPVPADSKCAALPAALVSERATRQRHDYRASLRDASKLAFGDARVQHCQAASSAELSKRVQRAH